jgi:hypothetical protein
VTGMMTQFILGLLQKGARRSNEIHDLTAKSSAPSTRSLRAAGATGKRVVTGLGSSGRRPGRAKSWALAEDVVIRTGTIKGSPTTTEARRAFQCRAKQPVSVQPVRRPVAWWPMR